MTFAKFKNSGMILYVFYFIFVLIQGMCLVFTGDDLYWYCKDNIFDNFGNTSDNGRYFTNVLTFLMTHNFFARVFIYVVFMVVLFSVINKILRCNTHSLKYTGVFVFLGFILMPPYIYSYIFNWVSGFTNYAIGTTISLIYLCYCLPLLTDRDFKTYKIDFLATFIVGFLGALCVENITIFNICFAIFIIVLSILKYKKIYASMISYLIASVSGAIIMFLNHNYNSIINENSDDIGNRYVEFNFPDIIMKIYKDIIIYYTKPFFFIHLVIMISVIYCYYKKYIADSNKSTPKYGKFCFYTILGYSFYSLLTALFQDYTSFSPALKIKALETAFVFVYIISLIYMAYILFDKHKLMRITVYLISTLILTGPFLFVNPVTTRCFFSDYIFWLLVAGEFLTALFPLMELKSSFIIKNTAIAFLGVFSVSMMIFNIANKYCDVLRYDYLREQLNQKTNVVEMIKLPYTAYTGDFSAIFKEYNDMSELDHTDQEMEYIYFLFEYVGIEYEDIESRRVVLISLMDYNTAHSE